MAQKPWGRDSRDHLRAVLPRGTSITVIRRDIDKYGRAQHLPDFMILAFNTGMRKGEMPGLEWRHVDLQEGLIFLEGQHTKTARRRTVPLNHNGRSALLSRMRFRIEHCPASLWVFAHPDGERIQNIRRSFETACHLAKTDDFRIHDMRHTCAAWLVSNGIGIPEVRDLLGHRNITTTERYAHLAPENVRAAVAILDNEKSEENTFFQSL